MGVELTKMIVQEGRSQPEKPINSIRGAKMLFWNKYVPNNCVSSTTSEEIVNCDLAKGFWRNEIKYLTERMNQKKRWTNEDSM